MLECGYPNPYEVRSPGRLTTLEDVALINTCMISSGFTYDRGRYVFCNSHKELEACRPGAVVPNRDVKKRIGGRFCHAHATDPVCQ